MARFDILEAGFSSLDETVNFGMRVIADNTNLYEIVTKAVIRSSETSKVLDTVKMVSQYQGERIFFSTDKLLRIIRNKHISEVIGFYEFDYVIDTLCVSPCGRFLLIGTQDGKITIKTLSDITGNDESIINNEFPVVFEETLADFHCVGDYFKGSFFSDDIFYVVTSNGLVKKIVMDQDGNHLFKSEVIFDLKTHINICAFGYPYLCLEGNELTTLNVKNNSCQSDEAIGIKNLHALESYFFAYDNKGNIFTIHPNELIIFCVNQKFPNLVDNFHDVLSIDRSENDKVNFLGIRNDKNEIQLVQYPGSEIAYSMGIQGSVHLLSAEEDVLFFTEIRKNNILSEIRLQNIIKADPEFRLQKLLQKELFKEAEIFAKTFNISPEIIARAKALSIVNKNYLTTKDIDQLLDILDTVDDHLFKLNCCNQVDCESGPDVRRILLYGAVMDIPVKDCSKNKDNILLVKKMDFNDKLHRFDTFMQIYRNFEHCKWKYFVGCDFIDEVKTFLQQGEIENAAHIYSRLDRTTIQELTAFKIEQVASMLKRDHLTNTIFLNTFIPTTLKYVPDSIGIFVEWLHDKVYQLENLSGQFPDCAIKLAEDVIKLIDVSAPVKRHVGDLQDPICLLKALRELKMFLNSFGIKFPLSEYLYNPLVVLNTLASVNNGMENFEVLMTDFLCPLFDRNNIDMELLMVEGIENLLGYEEKYWINMVPILLKFITSIDKKLDVAYKILEITEIPWSQSIKSIAQFVCQLAPNHPIATKITANINNEQILIILRKYNIQKEHFETLDDKIFCFKRIIYLNEPSYVEDIRNLCTSESVRQEADLAMINNLIVKKDYDKAMNILGDNKPEQIVTLCKHLLDRCLIYATSYNDLPKKYRDPYFSVLNPIWTRLKKYTTSLSDKEKLEFDYKIAYGIYGISKYFDMQPTCTHMTHSRRKNILLNVLVQKVTEPYSEDDNFDFQTFILQCKKLAKFFDINLDEVFIKCLDKTKNGFNPFLKLGQYLLNTSECPKLLTCWALYQLKYVKHSPINDCDETLSNVFTRPSKNPEDYLVGIQLARKLTIKAMTIASPEDYSCVMEVIRWIDSFFYLTNPCKHFNIDALQIYFPVNALSHGMQSIEAIKSLFNIYCTILGSRPNPSIKHLTWFTANITLSEDELNRELERLTWNINTLLKEGHHLICFNVFKTIQQGFLCNSNLSKETLMLLQSEMETNWLPKTLNAVLSHRFIDKALLLDLMLLGDSYEKQLKNCLQIYKRQPQKLGVICQVGLELCAFYKNTQGKLELINYVNLCKWWNRIGNKNINYEFFFKSTHEDRLDALMLSKNVHLSDIAEYCSDFGLDLQKTYLKYLEMTLKSWQPNIADIALQQKELEEECHHIIKYITNAENVIILINKMWSWVNYYYYEVFMVMLSIRSKLSLKNNVFYEKYLLLLTFLKTYKRVSSPSRSEVEKWFGTFTTQAFIDPLSEVRLPLTETFFSSDIWTIIKPEINLETYQDWFKVVPILKPFLNKNDICTYAINSALPAGPDRNACNSWELNPKYDHIIVKVEECANNITDLERATAAVYTLMCSMTPGADKVRMAELSYKYAQMYRQTASNDDVEKVYIKVKQRYFNYAAIHILHKHQLAEEEYLKLVAQPSVLITTLYKDPRITKQICNCPDIDRAVDKLCVLFGLIAKKIKLDELMKFLKPESLSADLDKDGDTDCLLRAYYICGRTDFYKPLLKIGLNKDDVESNMSVRANALKCFYYSCDTSSLETMTQMTREEFLTYMDQISVLGKLQNLGLQVDSVAELDKRNKKLLRKLTEIDTPLAVRCIANICKIYDLNDLTYWEFIVNSAIRFNMIKDLREYVEYLRFRCVKDFIQKAWNVIISDAFKTETNTIEALKLLQTCPMIHALNMEEYIKTCISNKRLEIAAVLLQYVSTEKHQAYLKVILARERLFEDVAGLKNEVCGIKKVLRILESHRK